MLKPVPSTATYALEQKLSLATQQAHRTLKRLCKHFQHKVDVQWTQDHALIQFEEGICAIQADEQALSMSCEADNHDDLKAITDTMDRHVAAFCRDETFTMNWRDHS